MSTLIRDETANAVVLNIDNNGNMAFADGTPIDLLTIDGWGIIDHDGTIVHGLGSNSVQAAVGSANCGYQQIINFETIAGRTPIVQLITNYPATYQQEEFADPGRPTTGTGVLTTPLIYPVHYVAPFQGGFQVSNQNEADEYVGDPNSEYYDFSLTQAPFTYRWI